jgi:hypothetical protein
MDRLTPPPPTELSPIEAQSLRQGGKLHFGAIEGFKDLPHHLFYEWDATYAYTLCGEVIAKRRDTGDADALTLSVGGGENCQACFTVRNQLEAAYYDNHRADG